MANHPSAAKRHRQSLRRRDRNREAKAALRLVVKKARIAIESGDKNAKQLAVDAERALAKAASKGIIHGKNAARRAGRLASAAVATAKPATAKPAKKKK